MCGRFTNRYSWRQLKELYDLTTPFLTSNFPPRYNIAPTQPSFVVRINDGKRELAEMRWGLVPYWSKDTKGAAKMINAQSESADIKPAFRDAWRARRCLVVADGFYEWPEPTQPRFITLKGNEPFAFAGLWEVWGAEQLETFTILTTKPNDFMAEVHDRYGQPPPQVGNLAAVARLRILARRYGLTEISLQGKHIRFSPIELPDSKQLRLKRYHPDSVYKTASNQVSVPAPMKNREPLRDQELLRWCGQLLKDVLGELVLASQT